MRERSLKTIAALVTTLRIMNERCQLACLES